MAESDTLALSEDQHALQHTLRGFLTDQLPSEALRAALETKAGYSPELHGRLAGELGLTALTIPEEFGGLGMSQAEASVVHTELGRALYPGPFLSSALADGVLLAGDRRGRRALAAVAGRRVGNRNPRRRRRGRPLVARTGQRPRRAGAGRLAAIRAPVVRRGGPRSQHRRGPGRDRVRSRDVPGGIEIPGVHRFRATGPGPDPAGLRYRLRRGPGRAARPGRGRGGRVGPG